MATGVTSSVKTVKVTTKKTATTKAAPVKSVKGAKYVTVKSGDTLGKIAKRSGKGWRSVWALNKSTVKNPNMIKVGQKIRVA
ncbi:MAG: LysM peptidoglycan-binding domain-containing protein [Luteococcus sp.]|nr:LysM peptidoglycan-binding domain-containing protein [Luteococcus sp.]